MSGSLATTRVRAFTQVNRLCRCRPSPSGLSVDALLLLELDLRAALHVQGEVAGIPVREADADVRLGLADLLGLGRAVDAVGGDRQVDPDEADRIVRSRVDRELQLPLHAH